MIDVLGIAFTGKSQNNAKYFNWGEPQRAPQLRVDLDFRHSRYIYKSSVRPLGFVPATIQPKNDPAQIPYFAFAFLWL